MLPLQLPADRGLQRCLEQSPVDFSKPGSVFGGREGRGRGAPSMVYSWSPVLTVTEDVR